MFTSPPRTLASRKTVNDPNIQIVTIHETTYVKLHFAVTIHNSVVTFNICIATLALICLGYYNHLCKQIKKVL